MTQTGEKSTENPKKIQQTFHGVVVSHAMEKTLVVSVTRTAIHPKYQKRFRRTKNYKVHDEKKQFRVGDDVRFLPCRPLSKEKRWRVIYAKK
jgi:small subunit ribosomal protein S17